MGKVLTRDPATRIQRVVHATDREDLLRIETKQDVTGIVEENLLARDSLVEKAARKFTGDHFHKAASIPVSVYYGPARVSDPDGPRVCDLTEQEFRAWLNDPNNRAWRTSKARL